MAEDLELHGVVSGTVTVSGKATLVLRGMVIGDVILEARSAVEIFGIAARDVINLGGRLRVHGTVLGKVVGQTAKADCATADQDNARRAGGIFLRAALFAALPTVAGVNFAFQAGERGHNHPGWLGMMSDLAMAMICFAIAVIIFAVVAAVCARAKSAG
ncbi:hypothetical protein LVJ94_48935 [Pendulispora rubella]|uniref:Polymer-forming cytoskeletal protein n=1 Tax=Pendulispora rubella TaxID=2741070 RepID=A0ABZ2L1H3_9BACT